MIKNITIINSGSDYSSEPGIPPGGLKAYYDRITPIDRQFGNNDCPRLGKRWLAYKSDGEQSITYFEPFSWQGGYVWGHTNRGDRLWLYEEFWDWQKDTGAVMR